MATDKVMKENEPPKTDPMRKLRIVGAIAALLAVLGIAILVFWWVLRGPRF